MSGSLTSEQLDSYWENGFVKPIRAFSRKEASELRTRIEALEWREASESLPQEIRRYFRVNGQIAIPLLFEIASAKSILDAIESVLGPNLLVWSCELFIKEAGSKKIVTWHQDLTYWGMGGSDKQASAWVAITDVTERSGCMRFVPGSHKQDLVPHVDTFSDENLLSRGQEVAVEVDEQDAVLDELAPGEMSIHHGRIFHASGPNRSQDRRIGMVIRYVTPDLARSSATRDYAMLVRGVDDCGNWINVAPPRTLFGTTEMSVYARVINAQAAILGEGAEQDVPLYEVA